MAVACFKTCSLIMAFEVQATDGKLIFLKGLKLYPEAAYWPRLLPAGCQSTCPNWFSHARKERTWCDGKIRVSAMTTFSLRVAEKTITSAMSSGVNGSTPLLGYVSLIRQA